jgi:Carboxypeptidase regulatory-like domain
MGTIALLLAGFFIAPIPLNQSVYEGVVSIRGSVMDSSRNQPIGGATVYARSETDYQTTVSDEQGNFYFLQLFPGTYEFSAEKAGYSECLRSRGEPEWLDAGLEFLATVYLSTQCT